jgi:calcineurin-like phosphoesterase family protein
MDYFTSDWHVGEDQLPNTHSFLRPRPTELMVEEWIQHCHAVLTPDDRLICLGDMILELKDFWVLEALPMCKAKLLVLGDKELQHNKLAVQEKVQTAGFTMVAESWSLPIAGRDWFLSHKPSDCFNQSLPALCGHVHGIWRSQRMPNGQPIINVGIDAWGGLVSEKFIAHQYDAITKHYDDEAFPARW